MTHPDARQGLRTRWKWVMVVLIMFGGGSLLTCHTALGLAQDTPENNEAAKRLLQIGDDAEAASKREDFAKAVDLMIRFFKLAAESKDERIKANLGSFIA